MQIFVKTLIGQTIPLEVEPATHTVADVKEMIKAKENIRTNKQTILFNGVKLSESKTLQDLGIDTDGISLHLVVKASKGGCVIF